VVLDTPYRIQGVKEAKMKGEKNAQLEKNKNPIGKLFFSNWKIKFKSSISFLADSQPVFQAVFFTVFFQTQNTVFWNT
jgi:hypothetical protein